MSTLRDEDIITTASTPSGGDADQSDPAGVDHGGSDADGSDSGSDSGTETETETEITLEPRKGDADSSDS